MNAPDETGTDHHFALGDICELVPRDPHAPAERVVVVAVDDVHGLLTLAPASKRVFRAAPPRQPPQPPPPVQIGALSIDTTEAEAALTRLETRIESLFAKAAALGEIAAQVGETTYVVNVNTAETRAEDVRDAVRSAMDAATAAGTTRTIAPR